MCPRKTTSIYFQNYDLEMNELSLKTLLFIILAFILSFTKKF